MGLKLLFIQFILAGLVAVPCKSATNLITVGDPNSGARVFRIANVTSEVGDKVAFLFTPGNHSITQSSFDNPCQPLPGGFDSGWLFVPDTAAFLSPSWDLTITDASQPIWFYCKQRNPFPHCRSGMVGAINAPLEGPQTFEKFKLNAAKDQNPGQGIGNLVGIGASASAVPYLSLVPGETLYGTPSGAPTLPPPRKTTSASRTPGSSTFRDTSSQTSSTISSQNPESKKQPPIGAILGSVFGAIAFLALLGTLLVFLRCRRRRPRGVGVWANGSGSYTDPFVNSRSSSTPIRQSKMREAITTQETVNPSNWMSMKEAQRQAVALDGTRVNRPSLAGNESGALTEASLYVHQDSGVILSQSTMEQLPPRYNELK